VNDTGSSPVVTVTTAKTGGHPGPAPSTTARKLAVGVIRRYREGRVTRMRVKRDVGMMSRLIEGRVNLTVLTLSEGEIERLSVAGT
jgi:hypothetical protein